MGQGGSTERRSDLHSYCSSTLAYLVPKYHYFQNLISLLESCLTVVQRLLHVKTSTKYQDFFFAFGRKHDFLFLAMMSTILVAHLAWGIHV